MTKPTIVDIANELGITPSTVSRALAGNTNVKESTRKAVMDCARKMGYERNDLASDFRRGVAHTVGIIVPRINREFFSSIISAAESVFVEAGYTVVICQTHEKAEDERRALKTLASSRVAGILISHSAETIDGRDIKETLAGGNIKLVQFDRVFPSLPGSVVVNDDFNGAYAATRHLIANGYKRIGALVGYLGTDSFRNRFEGYKAALADAGMQYDGSIVYEETIVRETGYECASRAIDAGCDALYSSGDFSALGALECARDRGLDIPGEFGIVGTANEKFGAMIAPSLSSVDQHSAEIGSNAAKEMLRLLSGKSEGGSITVGTSLVVRRSSSRNTK